MNNQVPPNLEIAGKATAETTKRKRKLLNDPQSMWAKCRVCKETGNLENLIRHQIAVKNSAGVELYRAFEYVYFCGEGCQGSFKG